MALDGAFLCHIKNEIEHIALGARIDKIYQPNKEEFVFSLRSRAGAHKLLMSARANSARVHFTQFLPENPAVPPMLCMLFRKKLLGAKLVAVRQPDLERVLFLDFVARNELGDEVKLTVAIEIMGRYSNIILIDAHGKILDALKRVDVATSSKRQILPGIKYTLPPAQDKLSILKENLTHVEKKINLIAKVCEKPVSEAILSVVKGVSPIVCNEIEFALKSKKVSNLKDALEKLRTTILDANGEPFIIYDGARPKDFSFIELPQHENSFKIKKCGSFSKLLDEFFSQRDSVDRMKVKSHDLRKQITTIISRLKKKLKIQEQEIISNENKDDFKLLAELVNANLYRIKNGSSEVVLENFYDENLSEIKIKLDPLISPAKNAEKFYSEYKKSKTAVEKLTAEMEKAQQEITYLESVLDAVNRANFESELAEIKNELCSSGYIKMSANKGKSSKNEKSLPPIEYVLGENVRILVGRNNRQNDKLTLKKANKKNLWFHVKDMPGSHTILVADAKDIDDEILIKAAKIAAYHSSAKDSSNVPVDFAQVKDVKKTAGAKPGMVVYNNYRTLFVTPDDNFIAF